MSTSVPGIQGKVALDGIEQTVRGLQQLAQAFDQVGGAAPKAKKPVDDIVAALIKFSVIKEAVGSLVSLGQATIQSYSDNERLASSLQSLVAKEELASGAAVTMTQALNQATGKSRELLGWTQQLAIQSPFSQQGVAQAFKMAQAYGFVSETASKADVDAKRLTQAMIDFASGSGQSEATMSRIALALGQIQAKGKLAGGEMLQLTEAGLNVRQILATAFGKTTQEIVAMQERGLIPANRAITAIVESLERDFGGAAKRQANTWAGLLNSISDIKEVGLREFFSGTFQAIQPLAQQFVETLSNPEVQQSIRAWGNELGQAAAVGVTALQTLAEHAQSITPYIAAAGSAWLIYKAAQNAATFATAAQAIATGITSAAETAGLIILELKTNGLRAATAATMTYAGATGQLALTMGVVAAAVGLTVVAYQKYQAYQQQLHDGAKWVLEQRQWWNDSTAAIEQFNQASQATKNATQGQADALTQLRDQQKQAVADYAAAVNAAQTFGDTSEATAQRIEAMRQAINARTQDIQNATSALETAVTYEELEANRLQISAHMALVAGDAYATFNQQIQALIGVTQQSADKSLIDAQAKTAQQTQTQLLQQHTINAANAFLALNPNIDGAGVASAQAAGKISAAVAQFIAITLATANARVQLAALQQQVGMNVAVVKGAAKHGGMDRVDAIENAGTQRDADQIRATTTQLKAQYDAEQKLVEAQRNQVMTTGSAAQKQALLNSEMDKAARIYGKNSAEYVNAKTALDAFNASQAKGGRAAAAQETKAAEKLQSDLSKIEESGQQKLLDIDRKYAEQRAAAFKALAADILTTSADMVAAQEANDLELVGMADDKLAQMVPRERAEAEARVKAADAAREAQQTAATEGAEFAQKQYDERMKQIQAQQRLDEEYYKKQQELAGNPEALAILQQQYDEATAAIAQASQIRIDLARQAADEAKSKAEEEKAAVIAAAQDQADKVKGASEDQKNAVISALQAQANQANAWAGSMATAADQVVAASQRAAGAISSIPAPGGGGTSSSAPPPQHGGAQAAGGGTFIAAKPMTLTVGDAPDPELITVTPLGRTGQTRVGSGWVSMAGGGAILDPSTSTNPALNRRPGSGGGGGRGRGKSPEQTAADLAQLEEDYLNAALQKKLEWRKKAEALDDEQYWAEISMKRARLPQERAIEEQRYWEDRNVKRQQRDRMRALEATWATQDAEAKKQLDDQFAAQDAAARQQHYGTVARNQQTYQMQLSDLQRQAQESQSETTDFWLTAQASLYYDQMQAQNQQSQDALNEQLQHSQDAHDQATQEISQAEQDRRDELRENLQHQFALEDQQRQDYWDITNQQRDFQYRVEARDFQNYYNDRKEAQDAALDKEKETFEKFWEGAFTKFAGGAAIYEQLSKVGQKIFAPEFLKLLGWAPRAQGGEVVANQMYVVGENRPEVFVPRQDGVILPRVPSSVPSGGVPSVVNLNMTITVQGGNMREIEDAIQRAVRKAIDEAGRRANTQIQLRSITKK